MSKETDAHKIFKAIKEFVVDVYDVYGEEDRKQSRTGITPFVLYKRLLEKTGENDTKIINKVIDGFYNFYENHREEVMTSTIPHEETDIRIIYNDKIYINITEILSYDTDQSCIYNHLIAIYSLVYNDKKALEVMKQAHVSSSREGQVIDNITSKLENIMNSGVLEESDMKDPMAATMKLFKTGALEEVFSELKDVNPMNLLGEIANRGDFNIGEITGLVNNFLPQ